MPVLARLRLGSIGAEGARFDPLDLELVGPDGRLRHTLLALRNGGGKSSLIALVLLLLNPRVRGALGHTPKGEPKVETDYVKKDEAGVVLAEWLPDRPDPRGPTRLVTFMILEQGEQPGAAQKLFVAATLPFDVDAAQAFDLPQLRPVAARPARAPGIARLADRARTLKHEHPDWDVVVVRGHEPRSWLDHLRACGLDPGLADLLARMNLEEGDLAKALVVSSAQEFVDRTARLLAPPEEVVRDLHHSVRAWAEEWRARGDRRSARDALAALRPAWTRIVERLGRRTAAEEQLRVHGVEALGLVEACRQASVSTAEAQAASESAAQAALVARTDAATKVEQLEGERLAADAALAGRRAETAEAELRRVETAETEAKAALQLARAVVPAVRLVGLDAEERALRAARRDQETEVAPRAARRDALALALAERAKAEVSSQATAERVARTEAAAADAQRRAHHAAHDRAQATEARAAAELAQARMALQTAERARAALVGEGLLTPGDTLEATAERAQAREAELAVALEAQLAAASQAEADARQHDAEARRLGERRDALARDLAGVERKQAEAVAACETLARRVVEAGLASTVRLPDEADRTLAAVGTAWSEAVSARAATVALEAGLDASCQSLRTRGVLPPPRDVERVVRAGQGDLEPALAYLAATLGPSAAEVLDAVPALAHAVVAPSAAGVERVEDALAAIDLEVDAPVPVFVAADLDPARLEAQLPRPRLFVGVEPHTSEAARDRLLDVRVAELERTRGLLGSQADRVELLATLQRDLQDGLARWGAKAQAELAATAAAARAGVLEAADGQRVAVAARDQARGAARAATELSVKTRGDHEQAKRVARRLGDAASRHGEALRDGPARVTNLEQACAAAGAERSAAGAARDAADETRREAERRATRAVESRTTAERRERDLRGRVSNEAIAHAAITDVLAAEAELDALHCELVQGREALEGRAQKLRLEIERVRLELNGIVEKAADLAERARQVALTGMTETDARARAKEAEARHLALVEERGGAKTAREASRKALAAARRKLESLTGAARAAADVFAPPVDEPTLEALVGALPGRLEAARAVAAACTTAADAAEQRKVETTKLAGRWSALHRRAADAWEGVRQRRLLGVDIERAVVALVRPDQNVQVVLDAAKQYDALARDVERLRAGLTTAADALVTAEREWLDAAREASTSARSSTSERARALGSVHVAITEAAQGDPEAREAASLRALAERAEADLALIDREIEDLDAELADVTANQATLSRQLAEHVRQLGSRVRTLERASTLPEGLDAWSNKRFVRLDLPLPSDEDELGRSVAAQLSSWAEADATPTTRELLPRLLARCLLRKPSVAIPKADRFDRWHTRPIEQLTKDSGGEQLTAAFILFCVLARVVSGPRNEHRTALALIDNPLGTANRFDFVEAQCRVAAAFGVQYVAASGITDPAAVERFERLVTLTNPGQGRVRVERAEDRGLGRSIEAVTLAREAVLSPPGAPPRAWAGEP